MEQTSAKRCYRVLKNPTWSDQLPAAKTLADLDKLVDHLSQPPYYVPKLIM